MKKSLVFAMAMALGVSATAFAANPFSDLPAPAHSPPPPQTSPTLIGMPGTITMGP